jgi:hypothetical protein
MECNEPLSSPTRVYFVAQENETLEKKDKIMENHDNHIWSSPVTSTSGEKDTLVLEDQTNESYEIPIHLSSPIKNIF